MAGATLLFTQRAPRPLTRKGKSDPLGGPLIVEPHRITKLQCEMEGYMVGRRPRIRPIAPALAHSSPEQLNL